VNQWRWRRLIARLLGDVAPVRGFVLDLPCGTGRLASLFADLAIDGVGADLSTEMLSVARGKLHARLLVGDAERLPFRDDSFDGIVSLRFMSHPPAAERARILGEMARVARRFVLVDVRCRNPFREAVRRATAFARRGATRKERPDLGAIAAELRAAGLAVRRVARPSRLFSDNALVLATKGFVARASHSLSERNPVARPSQ
jgi:ubiquinone/menaquinone biosynthesis C-methylase UbiE